MAKGDASRSIPSITLTIAEEGAGAKLEFKVDPDVAQAVVELLKAFEHRKPIQGDYVPSWDSACYV